MPLGANMCHSHSAKPVTFSLRCVLHIHRQGPIEVGTVGTVRIGIGE